MALERVANALQAAGCARPDDPKAVDALRGLGGLSQVLEECGTEVLAALEGNPRADRVTEILRLGLDRGMPELRQLVQGSLQKIFGLSEPAVPGARMQSRQERQPLTTGFHTEVRLDPESLPWSGWADAIKLGEETCEIIDYKTGVEDPSHDEQLRLYALLWFLDQAINPTHRRATHLTVAYPGATRSVSAPTEDALAAMEQDVRTKSEEIAVVLEDRPPRASVAPDNCRFCDVRQICDDAWEQQACLLLHEDPSGPIRSVQLNVDRQLGPRSWNTIVEFDTHLPLGSQALLFAGTSLDLRPRMRIRLIDARVEDATEEGPVVHLGSASEIYVLEAS